MYTLYEKKIHYAFFGDGIETLICKDGVIVAHVRGWDSPYVVDYFNDSKFIRQPVSKRGKGWRKLSVNKAIEHHAWIADILS